jgi:transposase-like protein
MKVASRWRHVYWAIDQHGRIIDVDVSPRRDTRAARPFFAMVLGAHGRAGRSRDRSSVDVPRRRE